MPEARDDRRPVANRLGGTDRLISLGAAALLMMLARNGRWATPAAVASGMFLLRAVNGRRLIRRAG